MSVLCLIYISVPQPHYPLFTVPSLQSNLIFYIPIKTNGSYSSPIDYFRQLANFAKAYQKKEKYYKLGDNFTLKLKIYYNRLKKAGLFPKTYIKGITYIVKGETITKFYKVKHLAMMFKNMCRFIRE